MPRSYGTTNAAPYASAPAVGAAGDTYYNTANKTLYVSDGTAWNPVDDLPTGGTAAQLLAWSSGDNPIWLDNDGALRGILSGTQDLNLMDATYVGVWALNNASMSAPNLPTGLGTAGMLWHARGQTGTGTGVILQQRVSDNSGNVLTRHSNNSGSTWTAWMPLARNIAPVSRTYAAGSGNWPVPANLLYMRARLVGGGGGGGGATGGSGRACGSGGGGGGYSERIFVASELGPAGTNYSYTVGAGGSAGTGAGADGGVGAATVLNTPTVLTGNGGGGGFTMASMSAPFTSNNVGDGGTGSGGAVNIRGMPGHPGLVLSATVVGWGGQGGGGAFGMGPNTLGPTTGNVAGTNGRQWGSGGSGGTAAAGNQPGGGGGDGRMFIEEYYA